MSQMLSKKLVLITVAAADVEKSRQFYEAFFGVTFSRALTDRDKVYHTTIDESGIDFNIGPKHSAQETIVTYYAVNDLNAAINEAKAAGGKVIAGPGPVTISPAEVGDYKAAAEQYFPDDAKATAAGDWNSLGEHALIADPAGNAIGLAQLATHIEGHFNAGKHQRPLSDHQIAVRKASLAIGEKHEKRVGK